MESTLLCNLRGPKKGSIVLRLRLLHMWAAKSPNDPRIFNFCTLWVDETGMLIHGLSHTAMAGELRRDLMVGKIYVVGRFGLNNPATLYRACSFNLSLSISPATSFDFCLLPSEGFPTDSYEFLPYSLLSTRAGDHRLLTDVVGRLHSISGISHKNTNTGSTVKQTVVIEDENGATVLITLWDEFSRILDYVALTQADAIEPIILAFGGLLVTTMHDCHALSTSAGARVAVNPQVPRAYELAARFADSPSGVGALAVEFATAEDAAADGDRRAKSLAQLLSLARSGGPVEERHRCSGIIVDVESRIPWYYNSCKLCSKVVAKWRDHTFWCTKDWQIEESQTRVCYKLQLTLRDDTAEARFIVMGGCGQALANISASYLAQRFPHQPGQLPPQLSQLRGQHVKFDCKLPLPGPSGISSDEFRVTQVVPPQIIVHEAVVVAGPVQRPGPQTAAPAALAQMQLAPGLPTNQVTASVGVQFSATMQSAASSSCDVKGKGKDLEESVFESLSPLFAPATQHAELFGPSAAFASVATPLIQNPPTSGDGVLLGSAVSIAIGLSSGRNLPVEVTDGSAGVLASTQFYGMHESHSSPHDDTQLSIGPTKLAKTAFSPRKSLGAIGGQLQSSSPPSPYLLLSPLAKIKVEKLDAAEIAALGVPANVSLDSEDGGRTGVVAAKKGKYSDDYAFG